MMLYPWISNGAVSLDLKKKCSQLLGNIFPHENYSKNGEIRDDFKYFIDVDDFRLRELPRHEKTD